MRIKEKVKTFSIINKFIQTRFWLRIRQWLYCYCLSPYVAFKSRCTVRKLKNKHKGQRCFIIGNGPSLRAQDLDLLKDEICFGANRIYEIYKDTEWRATYYCVQDNDMAVEMAENASRAIDNSAFTFIRALTYKKIKGLYRKYKEKMAFIPMYTQLFPILAQVTDIKFSDNAGRNIYDGSTVTYMSMQLAAYMGFSEIYLLGVDASFPRVVDVNNNIVSEDLSQQMHFYEKNGESNHRIYTGTLEVQLAAYQAAKEFGCKHGTFKIFNATRGGKLEIFERVQLEDILEKKI